MSEQAKKYLLRYGWVNSIPDMEDGFEVPIIRFSDIMGDFHESQSQWISVAERLPEEKGEDYLVAVRNKNKDSGIWLYDVAQFTDEGTWGKQNTWERVVFWKPKPLPPKN